MPKLDPQTEWKMHSYVARLQAQMMLMTTTDCPIVVDYDQGPVFKVYTNVDEEDPCEFCGNLSRMRDARGNCPACGGPRKEPK